MFRTSNCSSSGGVLYKQLTVFHHFKRSLVADTIRMILEWTLKTWHKIYKRKCHYLFFSTAPQHSKHYQPRYVHCDNFCTIRPYVEYQIIIGIRAVANHNTFLLDPSIMLHVSVVLITFRH